MIDPSISVIIPTQNSRNEKSFALFYVLKALLAQDALPMEVIVVNDHGTDESIPVIQAAFPEVVVINSPSSKGNVSAARNHGAKVARGNLLLFLDDDTILPEPDTLAKLAAVATHYDFCCGADRWWTSVYWYKNVRQEQSISSTINTLRSISVLPRGIDPKIGFRDLNEFTFIGNFGLIRRPVFEAIEGFDERFGGWGLEDTDLMMRLCLNDYRYALLNTLGISVLHLTHVRDSTKSYIRNAQLFNDLELERGFYFHVNHFFNVFEADGFSLFTKI
jgi:GT2 family glycosyltransferase